MEIAGSDHEFVKTEKMNYSERLLCKQALIDMLVAAEVRHHIVAELPPGATEVGILATLRHWAARVDRHYLGRNWAQRCRMTERLAGAVFLERGKVAGLPHAHMVVRPPVTANDLHFVWNVPFWFAPHPVRELRSFYPRPVTERGKMHITPIGETVDDRRKVASYAAKGLERSDLAYKNWCLVADLDRFSHVSR